MAFGVRGLFVEQAGGRRSSVSPSAAVLRSRWHVRREITGARFAAIAGAAHFPNMERADEFNELVLAFLAEAGC